MKLTDGKSRGRGAEVRGGLGWREGELRRRTREGQRKIRKGRKIIYTDKVRITNVFTNSLTEDFP